MNCKEYYLDDVLAVIAIPLANIPSGSADSPVNSLTATIERDGFRPSMSGAITIGMQPAVMGGALIPIMRGSGKAKDEGSDGVAGRLHSVSVTCEVDDRDGTAWENLLALERTPRHLLLTFRNNEQALVAATGDTYLCNVVRDGAKTSVSLRIQNLMGMQLLA